MANKRNYKKTNKGNSKTGSQGKDTRRDKNTARSDSKSCGFDEIKGNDISWWNKSSLYGLATNVPYNKMPGYVYDQTNFVSGFNTYDRGRVASFPSVMAIKYVPSLGIAEDGNSPVNLCFNSLFAELVAHYNNANVGFQQADLALLTLAVSSIINQIAECERALGLTNLYTRENATFPKGLIEALDYDFDELINNKGNYVLKLQSIVQNFNALRIPSYIDLFKRNMQLGRNIYMDEDHLMSQAFLFKADGSYRYVDTEMKLEYTRFNGTESFASKLFHLYNDIEALRNTSDLGNIMGVLRRAFPETATIQLDIPTTTDLTLPYYDRNVTWQINNMMICPYPVENLDIVQDPVANILKCSPVMIKPEGITDEEFFRRVPGYGDQLLVNSYNGEIGPEFIMESTRFMFTMDFEPDEYIYSEEESASCFHIKSMGTELVADVAVYEAHKIVDVEEGGTYPSGDIIWTATQISPVVNILERGGVGLNAQFANFMRQMVALTKFRNHPRISCTQSDSDVVDSIWYGFIGDYNVFTAISRAQLEYINLAALQSVYLITVSGERTI